MAITINKPLPATCVYGDIYNAYSWLVFDVSSDQTAQPKFYYKLEIFDNYDGVSAPHSATYRVLPNADGKGIFDVSEFVKVMMLPDKTANSVSNTNTSGAVKNNGLRSFFVRVSEVYGTTPTVHDTADYQFAAIRASSNVMNDTVKQAENRVFIDVSSEGGVNPYGDNDQRITVNQDDACVVFNMARADPNSQEADINFVRVLAYNKLNELIGAKDILFNNSRTTINGFLFDKSILTELLNSSYLMTGLNDADYLKLSGNATGSFTNDVMPPDAAIFALNTWIPFISDSEAVTVTDADAIFTSPIGNTYGFATLTFEDTLPITACKLSRVTVTTSAADSTVGDGDFEIIVELRDRAANVTIGIISMSKTDFLTNTTVQSTPFFYNSDVQLVIKITNLGGTSTVESIFKFSNVEFFEETEAQYYLPEIFKVVDNTCDYFTQFLFVSQSGAIKGVSATKRNQRSSDIKRSTYLANPVQQSGGNITKRSYGTTVYDVQAPERYSAVTDWITDEERNLWEELLVSPDVCVNVWNGTSSDQIPIVIKNASWAQNTQVNEKCWNLTIEYEMSVERNYIR